jgi:hypothetical protein
MKTLYALCALIESLSPKSRKLWDAAKRKQFDIGFDARFSSNRANRWTIDAKTLRHVTDLGASIAVTFYREDNTNTSNEKTEARRLKQLKSAL